MIGGLLMINILIAMMDHTQEMTNERTNEWVRQVIISPFYINHLTLS